MSPLRGGPRRIVVLGAAGVVGRWVGRHFPEEGDELVTADLGGDVDHPADACDPGSGLRAAVAAADTVVLALPEETAVRCLDWLPGTAPESAVIVSTCSVQRPFFERSEAVGAVQTVLGANPMFSPTLPSAGRPVVLVAREPCDEAERLRERLEGGSMTVTVMDPDAHDSAMSYLQALPHAAVLGFLGVLARSPVDVETLMRVAPPPARTLVALACRILAAPPEIYWDIQWANPEGALRRRELRDALERLDATVADGRREDFRAALAAAAERLGPHALVGADECREIFDHLQRTRCPGPADSPGHPQHLEHPESLEHPEHPEDPERLGTPGRQGQTERPERPVQPERPEKPEDPEEK